MLGHAHGRLDEALSLPAVLETRHCDAIVLLGDMQDQPRLLDDLRNSIVPVVALWQGSSPLEFPTVDVDNHAGIFAGLEHLVGLGHERIAFVSGQLPGDNPQRLDAFVEFMTRPVRRASRRATSRTSPTRWPVARRRSTRCSSWPSRRPRSSPPPIWSRSASSTPPTAEDRRVPDELSVVGFDDIPIAAHTVPALTTLRMPIDEMVGEGVRLAIELAREPGARARGARAGVRADPDRARVDGPAATTGTIAAVHPVA